MGDGRTTGVADLGYFLAALNQVASLDQQMRRMGVTRGDSVAVINLDQVAILRVHFGKHHHAAGGRINRRADIGDEVDALVHGVHAGERVGTPAKA